MNLTPRDIKALAQMLFAAGITSGRAVSAERQQTLSHHFAVLAEKSEEDGVTVVTDLTATVFEKNGKRVVL